MGTQAYFVVAVWSKSAAQANLHKGVAALNGALGVRADTVIDEPGQGTTVIYNALPQGDSADAALPRTTVIYNALPQGDGAHAAPPPTTVIYNALPQGDGAHAAPPPTTVIYNALPQGDSAHAASPLTTVIYKHNLLAQDVPNTTVIYNQMALSGARGSPAVVAAQVGDTLDMRAAPRMFESESAALAWLESKEGGEWRQDALAYCVTHVLIS
jgi:hypothetical protein